MCRVTCVSPLLLGLCIPVFANTIVVDVDGDGDFTDIQSAIDAAADGDEVLVMPGVYEVAEPIDFNRLHDPDDPGAPSVKNITLRSESGPEETVIRMSDPPVSPERGSVVIFENNENKTSVLEGFTLEGGGSFVGGGIFFDDNSSPVLSRCIIARSSSFEGSAIYCAGSSSPARRR